MRKNLSNWEKKQKKTPVSRYTLRIAQPGDEAARNKGELKIQNVPKMDWHRRWAALPLNDHENTR